jgi:hypothetical protein
LQDKIAAADARKKICGNEKFLLTIGNLPAILANVPASELLERAASL